MSKNMTDEELVEAVAREVLFYKGDIHSKRPIFLLHLKEKWAWMPFSDMNDLQMVKDKFDDYEIRYRKGLYDVCIFHIRGVYGATRITETRAWLEAALAAKRGEV